MTAPSADERGPERTPILRHTLTVLAGQLAVMAFGVTDTVVAGRYSDAALAAMSIGSAIYISVYVALMGILQALLPVWSELRGAARHHELGRSFRQATRLCLFNMAVGMIVLTMPGALMEWTQVPQAMQGEVRSYLGILACALPAALFFRMYSTLNQSLGRPQLVTWLQLGSLCIKVPLSVLLTFGGLGLDPMGASGCAWATLIVNYGMTGLAVWLLKTDDLYRPYQLWKKPERPDWHRIAEFARLGVPNGLAIMVEVTSFTLMALFVARQGSVASAAHQIASNMAAVLYMVPMSIGIAASARVSYWMGAGRPDRVRAAMATGFKMSLASALVLAFATWAARDLLVNLYSGQAAVVSVAGPLLAWVALYHLADAVQAVCVFFLRCYRITVMPLMVYGLLLWGVGLAGGYRLAYFGIAGNAPWQSPAAFWAASAAALTVTAVIFVVSLRRASLQTKKAANRA